MRPARSAAALVSGVVLLAACGGDDSEADADLSSGGDGQHSVLVEMVDTVFKPDTLDVDRGQTVRFDFTNSGDLVHEAFIGNAAAQADHQREMRRAGDDEHSDVHKMDGHGRGPRDHA